MGKQLFKLHRTHFSPKMSNYMLLPVPSNMPSHLEFTKDVLNSCQKKKTCKNIPSYICTCIQSAVLFLTSPRVGFLRATPSQVCQTRCVGVDANTSEKCTSLTCHVLSDEQRETASRSVESHDIYIQHCLVVWESPTGETRP